MHKIIGQIRETVIRTAAAGNNWINIMGKKLFILLTSFILKPFNNNKKPTLIFSPEQILGKTFLSGK